jgi:hypothetical protein
VTGKWEGKHDAAGLADELRLRLRTSPTVPAGALGEKRMFGGVCFLLRHNMLCGAGKNGYMFRTDPARAVAAAALPGGAPVIMQGRTMKGFYWVDPDACDATGLAHWLALAQEYVGAMPPRAAKKPRRQARAVHVVSSRRPGGR